jgi:hypothetical protein
VVDAARYFFALRGRPSPFSKVVAASIVTCIIHLGYLSQEPFQVPAFTIQVRLLAL